MKPWMLGFLNQLATATAAQFGKNCEVVVHDLSGENHEHTVVAIENGNISSRSIGDGPSQAVLEALRGDPKLLKDHLCYLTQTDDGRILRSSTVFVRDENSEKIVGIFAINYDITALVLAENALKDLAFTPETQQKPERIVQNVNALLDELLQQSVEIAGKPVALMTKEDKVRALQFLNESGAFLITKSSEKVCKFFGITKYALYHSIDIKGQSAETA
ncbi:MAG: helix-turn-helix transcriptional regulator [Eubacteriales bacterium]|nr:helix-turn-helix transcriptional regulator [Eubacteriales bacterium]